MKYLRTKFNQALGVDEFAKLYQLALEKIPSRKGKLKEDGWFVWCKAYTCNRDTW